jgi:hypothetical protein
MLRTNQIFGKGINLYLNGKGYSYFKFSSRSMHSFLIPKTHYNLFVEDLKQFDLIITALVSERDGDKWYTFDRRNDSTYFEIFEDVYLHENYFELRLTAMKRLMDEVDIRDFRINTILENEI